MEIVFLLTGQLLFAIFFTENIPAIINKLEQSKNADHKISEVVKYYKLQRIHFDNIIKNTFQYRASFSCIVILINITIPMLLLRYVLDAQFICTCT